MEEDVRKEIERQANEIVEKKTQETQIQETGVGVGGAVGNVKGKIVDEAMNKVDNNKSVKKHAHELAHGGVIEVCIDGAQRGVGGDVPALACTKKRYKILPNRFHEFSFVIKA